MTDDIEQTRSAKIKTELLQPTIRLVIALVVLGVILAILTRVPGVDRVIVEPDITVATLLFSVLVLILFGAVLNYATVVGATLADTFPGFPEIERIVQLITLFAIVVVAYQVFWWVPYFRDNPGEYDLLFLVLGLGIGTWLGYLLYTNVDDISDLFTERIIKGQATGETGLSAGDAGDESWSTGVEDESLADTSDLTASAPAEGSEDAASSSEQSAADDATFFGECKNCGSNVPADAQYCPNCGAEWSDRPSGSDTGVGPSGSGG